MILVCPFLLGVFPDCVTGRIGNKHQEFQPPFASSPAAPEDGICSVPSLRVALGQRRDRDGGGWHRLPLLQRGSSASSGNCAGAKAQLAMETSEGSGCRGRYSSLIINLAGNSWPGWRMPSCCLRGWWQLQPRLAPWDLAPLDFRWQIHMRSGVMGSQLLPAVPGNAGMDGWECWDGRTPLSWRPWFSQCPSLRAADSRLSTMELQERRQA